MLEIDCISSVIAPETKNVIIAYSGGVDSHVLLHLAASHVDLKPRVTAIYVDHGLQLEAKGWAGHCQTVAYDLGVKFKCLAVKIKRTAGQSLEELARDARYQALKTILGCDDVVLFAQHREDQMETVLLQLFRGAGVQGLSAMPQTMAFGAGTLIRPFLDVSKQEINDYAVKNKLCWVEDPSNKSDEFDRNFLRNQIVPQLKQKWPALDKTVARSARHCASAHQLTESVAEELLNQVRGKSGQVLSIVRLLALDDSKQYLVVRQWFKCQNLKMPSEKRVQSILNEVVKAKAEAHPEIKTQAYCIRRYRGELFCIQPTGFDGLPAELQWVAGVKQLLLSDGSKLELLESSIGIPKAVWESAEVKVRFRQGAEKISLPGRVGRHTLKNLYQEKAIPPWQRGKIPLLYLNNKLAAVADLWVDSNYFSDRNEPCYRIGWVISEKVI